MLLKEISPFNPLAINLTKYMFFTGKGGVGKTTTACATAVKFAKEGKNILLVSTDPASNLQDVFETELTNKYKSIEGIPNLSVANFDPVTAVDEYMESVVGPYRGVLPDTAVANMEEQLSGSCTVEIAAFNEFANLLTDEKVNTNFDYVLFDTAPTGHTLRMLQLPAAWDNYLDENTTGTSCLGQLSGLGDQQETYKQAVKTLSDGSKTTLILVSRPQKASFIEASRASQELQELDINNQILVINGVLPNKDDEVSTFIFNQQAQDMNDRPEHLKQFNTYQIPLRTYNVTGLEKLSILLDDEQPIETSNVVIKEDYPEMMTLINELDKKNTKIIFTMGKGGVGKTSIAIEIADELSQRGKKVRLATTDPADHLHLFTHNNNNISISHIDENKELEDYTNEVLEKARQNLSEDEVAYVEEDLKSPCTQEIAVFRRFAEIVDYAEQDDVVVIDTAPTGHTLLLLESSQNYAKEVEKTSGEVPESITKLLPRLQNHDETEVIMVTLPETTPVYESMRLDKDLDRADIAHDWWIVNQSMFATHTTNELLKTRAMNEVEWIDKVSELSNGKFVVKQWNAEK
ncbi:arsenical pump-driving ATPase [Vagococcus carniphilus]|uniref:Arsenical pump-driving ATPase n=1 Tax=Vagococcus carniphilus TaxID=218144 RepID=A0AAW8U2K4_9ENTE|nr:arsenical pump-driving ATPase [Vagococcus carniphilus]MDT2833795.1 arsenical pump-driving ATPase [Vagococcus carniphilus]